MLLWIEAYFLQKKNTESKEKLRFITSSFVVKAHWRSSLIHAGGRDKNASARRLWRAFI